MSANDSPDRECALDRGHEPGENNGHDHDLRALSSRRLWWALGINLVFLGVEIVGGILTHSLALLADAGHMLTDVAALALAIFMARLARSPATPGRTFGLLRAEVLGAFVNGATLVLIVGLILRAAWMRLGAPVPIAGPAMLAVAVAGLLANLASARILAGSRQENLNVEGAFRHMMADALGSVGAIVAAAVISSVGWYPIDAIASVAIGLLILWSSWGLLRQTINILLEATPKNVDYDEVKKALEALEHIERVHDLHIWTITSGAPVLSAHISLAACCAGSDHWQQCLQSAQDLLRDRFGIDHSTLQIEPTGSSKQCELIEGRGHDSSKEGT